MKDTNLFPGREMKNHKKKFGLSSSNLAMAKQLKTGIHCLINDKAGSLFIVAPSDQAADTKPRALHQ